MRDQHPLAGALGLCRKAGALLWGSDRVAEAVQAGKAKLVLLTADASPRTRERIARACQGSVPCRGLPLTSADLAPLSPRPAAVFAVTDANLARLCGKQLTSQDLKEDAAYGV